MQVIKVRACLCDSTATRRLRHTRLTSGPHSHQTGNAKKIYKLDPKYLAPLRRTETVGVDGWDMTLYCEQEVQQVGPISPHLL